jgi:hypothetical protein
MPFETTLVYTEPLLRRAVFCFWRREVGVRLPIAVLAMAAGLAWQIPAGENSWFTGVLATVLLLGVGMITAVYVVHYRNTMAKFREMGKPEATFRADASTFTAATGIGTSTLQWSAVKEVWQFPDFWLLFFSRAHFMTLPKACLPVEMQEFILQRVRAGGGKVS